MEINRIYHARQSGPARVNHDDSCYALSYTGSLRSAGLDAGTIRRSTYAIHAGDGGFSTRIWMELETGRGPVSHSRGA